MSTTVPINVEIAPQFITFKPERLAFVLHNASDKPREVMFTGTLMTLPRRDVVGPWPELDTDGDPIPGTHLLEDRASFNPDTGEEELIFNSKRAVQHILGIQLGSDGSAVATSQYALGGVSLLPRRPTKEVWKSITAAGEDRAFLAQVDRARIFIQSVDETNGKRRAAGMDPIPGGPEYERARFLLDKFTEISRKEVESQMPSHVEDSIDMEIELSAIARVKALELVEKAAEGKVVDRKALLMELLDDPSLRIWAQKEYSIRRRGHQPMKDEQLKVLAESGATVADAEG